MRTIQRTGVIIGAVSGVTLFLAQIGVALTVVWGIALTGVTVGLVVAKWLPRAWYGRQFAAGVRAGVPACVMAGAGALASQWIVGPHALDAQLQRSHVAFVDTVPLVRPFAFLGWAGVDVLVVVLSAAAGIALAGIMAQAFALSKNRRTIRVVTQARQMALALSRDLEWESLPAPTTARVPALGHPVAASVPIPPERWLGRGTNSALGEAPRSATPRPGLQAPPSTPSTPSMPSMPPTPAAPAATVRRATAAPQRATAAPQRATASPRRATLAPAPAAQRQEPVWEVEPQTSSSAGEAAASRNDGDDDVTAPVPAAPRAAKPRKPSSARPADRQLTQAMRDALAAWAEESDESDKSADDKPAAEPGKAPARRPPQPSTYLNSAGPAPNPKKRKRNNTRDWLC